MGTLKLCAAAIWYLCVMSPAEAATIEWSSTQWTTFEAPTLVGEIQAGDADRLAALLNSRPFGFPALVVNSPGGSVSEAMRIAEVVKKLVLSVHVARDGICASACFFIFAAGAGREATSAEYMNRARRKELDRALAENGRPVRVPGFVGLHRPFQKDITSPLNAQAKIMRAVAQYLEGELIPRGLIDAMMARPSTDIYWLTQEDLKQLGEYSPELEEYFVQKCGYDRGYLDKIFAGGDWQKLSEKHDRADVCIVSELSAIRTKGMKALKDGWRPPPVQL